MIQIAARCGMTWLLIILVACTTTNTSSPATDSRLFSAQEVKGVVASAHTLASEAGVAILKQGGNAIDAAVATSLAISVVRPQSTGIGGGGFLLFYDRKAQKTLAYDFRERAPAKATATMYTDGKWSNPYQVADPAVDGHLSVGTPGLIDGLVHIHRLHGKLPFATLVQPAIRIAEDGFPVYPGLAEALRLRKNVLAKFPGSRAIFFKNNGSDALQLGDTLVQKDLAWTLRQIASQGRNGFYKGEVAKRILAEIKRGRGILTQGDLDRYRTKQRPPVSGTFAGHKIISMPPPSSGGVHIIQILNMLAGDDLANLGPRSPAYYHLLGEAMRRAFADRALFLGDPDFVKVPTRGLLNPAYAKALRATINPNKASTSAEIGAGRPQAYESPSTTHLSVVDKDGNAVSSTQTINYSFGSCVVAEGTGIVLNDEMDDFSKQPGVANVYGLVGSKANAIAANKTMLSSMTPTIVLDNNDQLRMVLGSPGGPRIITATLQTILNVLAFKMPLTDAVNAGRIHQQWLPDQLQVEKDRIPNAAINGLKKLGHNVVVRDETFGDVQAILVDGKQVIGVSDNRSEGAVAGY